MHSKLTTAVLIWAALYCANASVAETLVRPPPPQGEATEFTRKANAALAARLPLDDPTDFANATRGRLAQIEGGQIKAADGRVVFDASIFAFLKGKAPPTVNPSLWRQSQLTAEHGLFEVVDGVYQVRGYDLAVMTLIRGSLVGSLSTLSDQRKRRRPRSNWPTRRSEARPVRAVIITHSHADHWGGTGGVLTSEEIDGRQIPIVAPEGFLDHAVSENLMAGRIHAATWRLPAWSRVAAQSVGACWNGDWHDDRIAVHSHCHGRLWKCQPGRSPWCSTGSPLNLSTRRVRKRRRNSCSTFLITRF